VAAATNQRDQQSDPGDNDDCRNGKDYLKLGHSWRFSQIRDAPRDGGSAVRRPLHVSFELASQSIGVIDNGRLIAFAEVFKGRYVMGARAAGRIRNRASASASNRAAAARV
jgi:hypothetical protein